MFFSCRLGREVYVPQAATLEVLRLSGEPSMSNTYPTSGDYSHSRRDRPLSSLVHTSNLAATAAHTNSSSSPSSPHRRHLHPTWVLNPLLQPEDPASPLSGQASPSGSPLSSPFVSTRSPKSPYRGLPRPGMLALSLGHPSYAIGKKPP